jgi:hypothetical protein
VDEVSSAGPAARTLADEDDEVLSAPGRVGSPFARYALDAEC